MIVDQTTPNTLNPAVPAYVFGTYFGICPYRYDPSETNTFFGNEAIDGGINLKDRAEFYVPWVQNRGNVNQMFLGHLPALPHRQRRGAVQRGDVTWDADQRRPHQRLHRRRPQRRARLPHLARSAWPTAATASTSAPTTRVVSVSPTRSTSDNPTWTRVGASVLPNRPVDQIAVDRSNWRIAYIAFGGFGAATPGNSGHVFATTDGGKTWTRRHRQPARRPGQQRRHRPDRHQHALRRAPTSAPSYRPTAARSYKRLGDGMPKVAVLAARLRRHQRRAARRHARARRLHPARTAAPRPALVVSKTDSGKPVGPGSTIDYTITVRNIGNAAATVVSITDPMPDQHDASSPPTTAAYASAARTCSGPA